MNRPAEERQLLRALCQITDARLQQQAERKLRRHRWADPEHEVVFEAICRLARPGRPVARLELAAQLTRDGIPEIDLDSLFAPLPCPADELARGLAELPKGSETEGSGGEGG